MRRERRLRRFSGHLGRRRLSPLLKYGRYARLKKYKSFYSEEATPEESFEVLAEGLEQIVEVVEDAQSEAPDELKAEEEQIMRELEGKAAYSRIFSALARLKLYNVTAEELKGIRSLALQLSVDSLETLLKAYEEGDIPAEVEQKTGLGEIFEKIRRFFKRAALFVVKFAASLLVDVVPHAVLAGGVLKLLHWMLGYVAMLPSPIAPHVAGAIAIFTTAITAVWLLFKVAGSAQKASEEVKKTMLVESEEVVERIAEVLSQAEHLLKGVKLNKADSDKIVKFVSENRESLEMMAERLEKEAKG